MRVLKHACNFYTIEFTGNDLELLLQGVKSSVKIRDDTIELRRTKP